MVFEIRLLFSGASSPAPKGGDKSRIQDHVDASTKSACRVIHGARASCAKTNHPELLGLHSGLSFCAWACGTNRKVDKLKLSRIARTANFGRASGTMST